MEESDLEAVIPTLKLSFPSPKSRATVFEIVTVVGVLHANKEVRAINKGSVNSTFACLVPEAGLGLLKRLSRYLVCSKPQKEGQGLEKGLSPVQCRLLRPNGVAVFRRSYKYLICLAREGGLGFWNRGPFPNTSFAKPCVGTSGYWKSWPIWFLCLLTLELGLNGCPTSGLKQKKRKGKRRIGRTIRGWYGNRS
jgi:hypothetical protein